MQDDHKPLRPPSNEVSADSFAILSAPTITTSPATRLSQALFRSVDALRSNGPNERHMHREEDYRWDGGKIRGKVDLDHPTGLAVPA